MGNTTVTIFNLYCPSDKDLACRTMNLQPEKCLTVGDFNSHSTSWRYEESDRRGDKVEDWPIQNNLLQSPDIIWAPSIDPTPVRASHALQRSKPSSNLLESDKKEEHKTKTAAARDAIMTQLCQPATAV